MAHALDARDRREVDTYHASATRRSTHVRSISRRCASSDSSDARDPNLPASSSASVLGPHFKLSAAALGSAWHPLAMTVDDEELSKAILRVLERAARGRVPGGRAQGTSARHPHYLTAYQILRRLPEAHHQALINEYGEPGKNAGRHFTAVSRIAQIARTLADYDFMDASELEFQFDEGEDLVAGGSRVVGLYRLRRPPAG
jgi:hypothetical protein